MVSENNTMFQHYIQVYKCHHILLSSGSISVLASYCEIQNVDWKVKPTLVAVLLFCL